MPNERSPIQYEDAARVAEVMDKMAAEFAGSKALAGIGVLASFATALATLAREIEQLKGTVDHGALK